VRDLSAFDGLPTRRQIRAGIPKTRDFRPQPRVLKPARIEAREDGAFDLHIEGLPTRRVHAMVAEAHRLLEDGVPLEEIAERVHPLWRPGRPKLVYRLLRSYLLELHLAGVVEIPFEEPPAVFGDRFERVKLLGRGGMGLVYLCRDNERDGALVVLKHAWGWSTQIESADLLNRREATALSLLDHHLIPRLVHTFEIDGILHMVREFADGKPLLSFRHATKKMATPARLRIVRDACEAIHHIHDAGMLYLDVKGENFLYSELDGCTRLIDLGLCRPVGPTGSVLVKRPVGSPGYTAPEVITDLTLSKKADVFGLGRLMAFLALGTRPRKKQSSQELATLMMSNGVDVREADIMRRMAAEDPAARIGDITQVLAQIDAILSEEDVTPHAIRP